MANPSKIRAITASTSKTDAKDSLILTHLLRFGYIPRSYVPSAEIMRNRELLRATIDVGQEICRTKNRVHALLTKPGLRPEYKTARDLFRAEKRLRWLTSVRFGDHRDAVLQSLLVHLESLQREQDILKSEIARIGRASKDVDLLLSIKGVDFYAALIILSEIGDITRFRNSEALCAYAGLVPRVRTERGRRVPREDHEAGARQAPVGAGPRRPGRDPVRQPDAGVLPPPRATEEEEGGRPHRCLEEGARRRLRDAHARGTVPMGRPPTDGHQDPQHEEGQREEGVRGMRPRSSAVELDSESVVRHPVPARTIRLRRRPRKGIAKGTRASFHLPANGPPRW